MSSGGPTEFDTVAANYDRELQRGLRFTLANREFFARTRIEWLRGRAERNGLPSAPRVLDFGCGDGNTTPLLHAGLGAAETVGVDSSPEMIVRARQLCPSIAFHESGELANLGEFDLVYCSGVFHHIAAPLRAEALRSVLLALKPGGLFAFWENNPWNLGTRFVMSQVPFDRDAILVSPYAGKRLLLAGGFDIMTTDYLFFLPVPFRLYPPLERALAHLPLGGQYQVLARRPRLTS